MFNIPEEYEMKMSWEEAELIIMKSGKGNLYDGLIAMQDNLNNKRKAVITASDEDDFFYNCSYELNAYNVVFKGMSEFLATE